MDAGIEELPGIDDELLAQQRALDSGGTNQLQILEAALEIFLVCQDAQAGRSTGFVSFRNSNRIKIRLNDSSAGRRLLHFRNEPRNSCLGGPLSENTHEIPSWLCCSKQPLQCPYRHLFLHPGDFYILTPYNLLQNISRSVPGILQLKLKRANIVQRRPGLGPTPDTNALFLDHQRDPLGLLLFPLGWRLRHVALGLKIQYRRPDHFLVLLFPERTAASSDAQSRTAPSCHHSLRSPGKGARSPRRGSTK
ncbi:hypothetical protein Mapa_017440 [Marchantia paleacea]|nr:hypothetical protein Mapa_017440 [Marchantia paleacea]